MRLAHLIASSLIRTPHHTHTLRLSVQKRPVLVAPPKPGITLASLPPIAAPPKFPKATLRHRRYGGSPPSGGAREPATRCARLPSNARGLLPVALSPPPRPEDVAERPGRNSALGRGPCESEHREVPVRHKNSESSPKMFASARYFAIEFRVVLI